MKAVLGKQTRYQLVFAGPFGVGKTTALRAISDSPVVSTDVHSDEAVLAGLQLGGKTTTTVGLDYGEWHLPGESGRVSLIGVPGQDRFEAMWDALLPGSSGVVLWVYGDSAEGLMQCEAWLEILRTRNALTRLAVALTRLDPQADDELIEPFRALVKTFHPMAPVLTADPRQPEHVIQAVMMAISSRLPGGGE